MKYLLVLLLCFNLHAYEDDFDDSEIIDLICETQEVTTYDKCLGFFNMDDKSLAEMVGGYIVGKLFDRLLEEYNRANEAERVAIRERVRRNRQTIDARIRLLERDRQRRWERVGREVGEQARAGTSV